MIQTVALGIVGIYLIMVALAGNVQGLFSELLKERGFDRWLVAIVALKFIGDRAGNFGNQLVALTFLAMVLANSDKTGPIVDKITGYFNDGQSGK
jgi:hypothetical protein